MLTLEISDTQLQEAIQTSIDKLLSADNYSNPLNGIITKMVGTTYSKGTLTDQIEAKVINKLTQFMETPEFDLLLGTAVAKAIAQREITKDKK